MESFLDDFVYHYHTRKAHTISNEEEKDKNQELLAYQQYSKNMKLKIVDSIPTLY